MNINIKRIKIPMVTQEIAETLKSGQSVVYLGKATVKEVRVKDNFDGTHNADYIAKNELLDVRVADDQSITNDVKIKQKSRSQSLRHKAFRIAQDLGESEEALYQAAMDAADDYLENKRMDVLMK